LIRGPVDSPLHSPIVLFEAARREGRVLELETLCHEKHVDSLLKLGLEGKLFLNMSPEILVGGAHCDTQAFPGIQKNIGGRIVVELTESVGAASYETLREAVARYRNEGLQLAIDDLGEGFSSLRRWSELRPEYVKVDKYFVRGIDYDPVKRQIMRAMVEVAQQVGSTVIAEGIETEAELEVVRSLGVGCGQGFLLGRPVERPSVGANAALPGILGPRSRRGAAWLGRPGVATA